MNIAVPYPAIFRARSLWCVVAIGALAGASADAMPPPQMPPVWDRPTVLGLIENIDKPQNASILKIGYFARRGKPTLATIDGFAMLKDVIDHEGTGSRRWFLLQQVAGFAAFRATDVPLEEGFRAYADLFDHASQAQDAGALYPLRSAVAEFVNAVLGRLHKIHLDEDARTGKLLLKAWTISAACQEGAPAGARPLPWAEAAKLAHVEAELRQGVDKALSDPAHPPSYGILKSGVVMYEAIDSARAAALLQRARPLLPRDDPLEVSWFYTALVDTLTPPAKSPPQQWVAAVGAQEERVAVTGRGRGLLASLYLRSHDAKALDKMLAALSSATADEEEIDDVADAIFRAPAVVASSVPLGASKTRATDAAATLLRTYLGMERKRSVEGELRARNLLAEMMIMRGDLGAAKAIIKGVDLSTAPTTPRAQEYRAALQRLATSIDGPRPAPPR